MLVLLVMSPGNHFQSSSYNPLDGCVYIYLDMGTNTGVQIRHPNPRYTNPFFNTSFPGNSLNPKNSQKFLMSLIYSENISSRILESLQIWRSLKTRQATLFGNILIWQIFLQICAVGWEPNPAATKYLKKLEASYERCGFRVRINTETGVGIQNSLLKFVRMSQVNELREALKKNVNVFTHGGGIRPTKFYITKSCVWNAF